MDTCLEGPGHPQEQIQLGTGFMLEKWVEQRMSAQCNLWIMPAWGWLQIAQNKVYRTQEIAMATRGRGSSPWSFKSIKSSGLLNVNKIVTLTLLGEWLESSGSIAVHSLWSGNAKWLDLWRDGRMWLLLKQRPSLDTHHLMTCWLHWACKDFKAAVLIIFNYI